MRTGRCALPFLLATAAVDALHAHLRAASCGGAASNPLVRRRCLNPTMQHSKGWDDFGKPPFNFYKGFDAFMSVFPDEDREEHPAMFNLPTGVYELAMPRPLGIAFEEREVGRGIVVTECVEGGNAAKSGLIQPGDVLVAVTAIKCPSSMSRFERKLIPCLNLDYDTIVAAIGTNQRPRCEDVILQFMRPSDCDEPEVGTFLEFFEMPPTHVFRMN